jgi:signal transduction histidine kinase
MQPFFDTRVNQLAHHILDTLPFGGLVVGANTEILLANRDAAHCFGFDDPTELNGKPLEQLLPISVERFDDSFRACFSVKPERYRGGARAEVTGFRRDGTVVPTRSSMHPLRGVDDAIAIVYVEPVESVESANDHDNLPLGHDSLPLGDDGGAHRTPTVNGGNVAPKIQRSAAAAADRASVETAEGDDSLLESARAKTEQARLVESERLAAVDQMASGLAHESRNAIQRARACLDLLELEVAGETEHTSLLNGIRRALVDLNRNYEEVRSYAAPIILRRRPANLLRLFDETFSEFARSPVQRLHCVDISDDDQCSEAMIDIDRIKLVYRNLIDNSVAAANGSASLRVSARNAKLDDRSAVCVSVTDRSGGIRERIANNIFEPFYTTKHHGTGLGLAVCRRIIDAHGGEIRAANNSVGGLTVDFTVPCQV